MDPGVSLASSTFTVGVMERSSVVRHRTLVHPSSAHISTLPSVTTLPCLSVMEASTNAFAPTAYVLSAESGLNLALYNSAVASFAKTAMREVATILQTAIRHKSALSALIGTFAPFAATAESSTQPMISQSSSRSLSASNVPRTTGLMHRIFVPFLQMKIFRGKPQRQSV